MQTKTHPAPKADYFKGKQLDAETAARLAQRRRELDRARGAAFAYGKEHGGSLGEIMGMPLACLPSSQPSVTTRQLPMTQADFDEIFGQDYNLLANQITQSAGLVQKWTAGGSPLSPFFMRSACITARLDPQAWSLLGGAVTPPAPGAAPPRVPRVIPTTGIPDDRDARPAVLEYNHAAQRAFFDWLDSYDFQYLLQGNFLMINERARDVGMLDVNGSVRGFGTSLADPRLIAAECNAHFRANGAPWIFSDPNVDGTGPSDSALEPSLVEIQYASPQEPGVFGVCYPVRPHILFPGMNYLFLASRNNENVFHDRLQQELVFPAGIEKLDPNYADQNNGAGQPAIWAGHIPFRYGILQIGVIFRGAQVLPEECIQWLLMFGQPYGNILRQDPELFRQVDNLARSCGLAGIPRPLGDYSKDPRWQKTSAISALFTEKRSADGALAGFEVSETKISKNELRAALAELCTAEDVAKLND